MAQATEQQERYEIVLAAPAVQRRRGLHGLEHGIDQQDLGKFGLREGLQAYPLGIHTQQRDRAQAQLIPAQAFVAIRLLVAVEHDLGDVGRVQVVQAQRIARAVGIGDGREADGGELHAHSCEKTPVDR